MKRMLLFSILAISCLLGLNNVVYSQADIYTGTVDIYVTQYGKIQLYSNPPDYDTKQIERASILVGTGPNSVFDYNNDQDIEDSTRLLDTPSWGDYEIYGTYNNNYSGASPNVLIKQNVYGWDNVSFAIVKTTVVNRESAAIDAIVGLDLIPQVDDSYAGGDTVTYSSTTKTISINKASALGFKVLSEDLKGLSMFVYYSGYDTDAVYYEKLIKNGYDTNLITDPADPNVDDPVIIPSLNSKTIAVGDSVTFYWAIAYGTDKAAMANSMAEAVTKYTDHITDVFDNDSKTIPDNFSLEQNYPNPFNPSTNIKFSIPASSNVKLSVYNMLGQEVATLINSDLSAGTYSYTFDASKLSSGIYFYTIRTNSFTQTRKMMLLK